MEFKTERPIYRQIADYCFARILAGEWPPGSRIPSVRELAVMMTVNTHTVLKAFEFLQSHGIIAPRRGMGYFLTDDAPQRIAATRREDFFSSTVPALAEEMRLLGITPEQLLDALGSGTATVHN